MSDTLRSASRRSSGAGTRMIHHDVLARFAKPVPATVTPSRLAGFGPPLEAGVGQGLDEHGNAAVRSDAALPGPVLSALSKEKCRLIMDLYWPCMPLKAGLKKTNLHHDS